MSRGYKLAAIGVVLGFAAMGWLLTDQRSKTAAVQERLNKLCRVTQTALQQTARVVRFNGTSKEASLRRINSEDEITGNLALGVCLSSAFDGDAWSACRDKNDEACLLEMLDKAANGVQL